MNSEQLLNPRFEIIADYPESWRKVGDVLECPNFDNDFTKKYWIEANEKYPHLFREMPWWENRNIEEMPKKLKSLSFPDEIHEILEWDMNMLFGFTDVENRKGCGLTNWKPEFGYVPVD